MILLNIRVWKKKRNKMIKCVIIDDEPLAREGLSNYIAEIDFLEVVGQGSNPLELQKIMSEKDVDLIFLDIQMPKINGIDFMRMNLNLPMVIITTAYPSYALDGYDLDVVDYLLKPITFNRFFKAVSKAKELFLMQKDSSSESEPISNTEYFFLKCDNKFEKICFKDILFIQALQNYVVIQTTSNKYMSLMPLKNVEQNLDKRKFLKVHKSYIVSLDKIDNLESHELTMGAFTIPISRNYRNEAKEEILGNKLWKK